jgi:hypothetical protein
VLDPGVQGLRWNSKILCSLVDTHIGLRGEADGLDFEFFRVGPHLLFWHGQTPWLSLILWLTEVYQAQNSGYTLSIPTYPASQITRVPAGKFTISLARRSSIESAIGPGTVAL